MNSFAVSWCPIRNKMRLFIEKAVEKAIAKAVEKAIKRREIEVRLF
jgi:hypothetical protein